MITQAITFMILLLLAAMILVVAFGLLHRFGDDDRAFEAALKGLRWFLAGSVIAVVANAISSGAVYNVLVPGAMAIAMLIWVEYYFLGMESAKEAET